MASAYLSILPRAMICFLKVETTVLPKLKFTYNTLDQMKQKTVFILIAQYPTLEEVTQIE